MAGSTESPRYRVFKRGAAQWFVVDWQTSRDAAGPFADSFGAHDKCARLNNAPLSANGLPANRESELREALAVANAGFSALAMADGVTRAQVAAYARNRDFLISAAHDRYRESIG